MKMAMDLPNVPLLACPAVLFPEKSLCTAGQASSGTLVRFDVGLDGLSAAPFALTCLAMLYVVAVALKQTGTKGAGYYRLLLVMQTGLLGLFAARDTLLFFVFYESVTIPFIFLLGLYADKGRRTAMRFICLDAAGAAAVLLALLGVVAMGLYPASDPAAIPGGLRLGIFLTLVAGFTVRVIATPFFARIKAVGKMSDIVAGFLPVILLTAGGVYGALRFARPIFAEVSAAAWPWAAGLVAGGAICAGMYCAVLLVLEKGTAA